MTYLRINLKTLFVNLAPGGKKLREFDDLTCR